MPLITGVHGDYEWLEAEHRLKDVLALCPDIVVGRYVAITAVDSGEFRPTEADRAAGWSTSGRIAYSPLVASLESLPAHCCATPCGPFDEWYIYGAATNLGTICHANPFETEMAPPHVFAFVNMFFRPADDGVAPLFWKQLDWMRPLSYIGDGRDRLIFASCDKALFASVREALERNPNDES